MPNKPLITGRKTDGFPGFEHLTANYIYCPNQFFDVCLPHCSRGAVRLVAYLLRRTLGWLDANGDPIEQDIQVTYQELINEARISRGAISKAINEAITAGFIVQVRAGRPDGRERPSESACYMLRWDSERAYSSDPKAFSGFYAGEGNRSPVPNAFFDHVIPQETLAVVKVVGTVLRFTVGYQHQFGRRTQATLSYSFIQNYAKMGDRSTLSALCSAHLDVIFSEYPSRGKSLAVVFWRQTEQV